MLSDQRGSCNIKAIYRRARRSHAKVEEADMVDRCYSKGRKVILIPWQKNNGMWVCRFTIPGLKESEGGRYQDSPSGEYETEWEAKTAAFECAKRVLDSLNLELYQSTVLSARDREGPIISRGQTP
jgi:hypothetical protein